MGYAQPPTDPPTRRTINCPDCEGDGFIIMTVEGHLEDLTCLRCDGDGEIEYDPDDNPYAPDTWKEAEGIA
jgi:DnaJ-class molecular chaperone